MGFDTQTFRRAVGKTKFKKGAVLAYRGLTTGAIVFLYSTFATKSEVDRIRSWVQSQGQSVRAIEKELTGLHTIVDPSHFWHTRSVSTNQP